MQFRHGMDCCSCECQHDRSFQVLQDESRNKRRSATSGQRQQGVQDIKYKSLSRWDNFSFIRKPTVERFQGHQLYNILNLAHSWIRRNMGLFVFECFIILVVFISISGTVMLINNHNDKPDKFDKVLPIEPLTSSENKDDEYSDFWVSDDYKDIVTSHELKDNNPANEYKHVVSLHGHKNMMPATDQADKREKDKTNYMDTVLPLEKIGKFGEDNSNVVLDIPYQSVSLADFEAHLVRAKSAEELMKIFFKDPNLSAEQIRSIMYMKQNPKLYSTDFDPELPAHAPEAEDMEAAFAHHMEVMTSPNSECVPRPETERIEEVHEDSVKHFLPSCTIVHRCRKTTSCCPRGHECVPTKEGIELFDKKFMVLEMQRGSEHLLPAKEHMVVAKTFVNHTACECRRMLVSSNCDKDCPQQFRKERPGIDCVCTCRQGHGKCRRIQRGLVALDEEDLVCIKEGNCIIPECQTGEFDVAKGFCSRSQRHKRNRG
ncbi:uncharacterized protein LOC128228531 isoform X2 [Mya arenaria]|uniref:uncharacterized protein LOC128228531 isoform X2 n=2 Tax=Mya arenaria TaxID=6604 RepID=UPI0022E5885D|nr:uncharacterized protein LOC128228531 isoform X2 [Mya arenaria]